MKIKRIITAIAGFGLISAMGIVTAESASAAPPAAVRYGNVCKAGHTEKGWNNTVKYTLTGDYLNRCVYRKETFGFGGLRESVTWTVWKIEDKCGSYMQKRC